MNLPTNVTTQELADLLGVDRRTIYKWYADGKIPRPRKVGYHRVYNLQEVLTACRENCLAINRGLIN